MPRNCSLSSWSRDLAPSFSGKKTDESTRIQYMILRCDMVWLKMIGPLKSQTTQTILFMEEILHQLISRIYHLRGFIHPNFLNFGPPDFAPADSNLGATPRCSKLQSFPRKEHHGNGEDDDV